jgi:hypothetical protein
MRSEYRERVKKKGYGKKFHSLKDSEEEYVKELLGWVNAFRVERGLESIEGHTAEWHGARGAQMEKIKAFFEASKRDSGVGGLPELESCST